MQYQSVLYYRDKLTVEERAVYDSLMQQWMKMDPVITLNNGFFDISKIAQYILYDYPMLFYINYYNLSANDMRDYIWDQQLVPNIR